MKIDSGATFTLQLTFRDVLRAMGKADEQCPAHDVRDCILRMFKNNKGDYNKWGIKDIGIMAYAITRIEDLIELRVDCPSRVKSRLTLRDLRRKLEIASE